MSKEVITDYDKVPTSVADVEEITRRYMEKISKNEIQLAGIVRAKNQSQPKQKFDKKTSEPIFNDDGSPAFWGSYFYVVLAFEGGELDVQIDEKWFNDLEIGKRVLFTGAKGLKFGKIQDVFHGYVIL